VSPEQLLDLLTPVVARLYYCERDVLALRDEIREATRVR
jgi:hypothetical protein